MWPAGREESGHSQSWVREVGCGSGPSPGLLQAFPCAWEWVLHVSLSTKETGTGTWPFPWLHLEVEQTGGGLRATNLHLRRLGDGVARPLQWGLEAAAPTPGLALSGCMTLGQLLPPLAGTQFPQPS